MVEFLWLLPIAFGVGVMIGAVGIGGVLLIPAFVAFGGLGIHEAMATALFTFIFTGVVGSLTFQRRGSIDWRLVKPVCLGAVFLAFAGAWTNSLINSAWLAAILAAIIIFAGTYALANWRGAGKPAFEGKGREQQILLALIGSVTGFGAGLTGVGGPALSVPLMVLFGFPVLASIGVGQVIQIIAAVSGTVGNLQFGTVNFAIAAPIALLEIAGVFLGVRVAHVINATSLKMLVAILCIVVGVSLIFNVLGYI